jgi:hypothetical protein
MTLKFTRSVPNPPSVPVVPAPVVRSSVPPAPSMVPLPSVTPAPSANTSLLPPSWSVAFAPIERLPSSASVPSTVSVPPSTSVWPAAKLLYPVKTQAALLSIVSSPKPVNCDPKPFSVPVPIPADSSMTPPWPTTVPMKVPPASTCSRSVEAPMTAATLPRLSIVPPIARGLETTPIYSVSNTPYRRAPRGRGALARRQPPRRLQIGCA